MDQVRGRSPCFIDLEQVPRFTQTEALETTVLTGLQGERMMMVLNATLPGHSVPTHSHPHEQIGVVFSGRAIRARATRSGRGARGLLPHPRRGAPSRCVPGRRAFVMLDIFHPVREGLASRSGSVKTEESADG